MLASRSGFTYGKDQFISAERTYDFGVPNDVFCLHGRYHGDELRDIMDGKGVYVTILRDPVDQFVSTWDFFGLERKYNMSLNEFASTRIT